MGTFIARANHLADSVGVGDLTMTDRVDQVYTKYQELRDDLNHPRGGRAHALRDALFEHQERYLQQLADHAITETGSDLDGAAISIVVQLDKEREFNTPIEFFNLLRSGHQIVESDGEVIYDRPADVPRLSEAQLRAQRREGHGLDFGADTRPRLVL